MFWTWGLINYFRKTPRIWATIFCQTLTLKFSRCVQLGPLVAGYGSTSRENVRNMASGAAGASLLIEAPAENLRIKHRERGFKLGPPCPRLGISNGTGARTSAASFFVFSFD